MQDEAPEGQPQHPGDASPPESNWWPWPETDAEEPTGPRDGAPGPDETLSLPVESAPLAMPNVPVPGEAPDPVLDPRSGPEPEPGRLPEPEPVPEPGPEPAAPEPEPEAQPAPAVAVDHPVGLAPSPEAAPAAVTVAVAVATAGAAAVPAQSSTDVPNEAIPAVPPEASTEPIGSIPAAHARAVWSRVQASNWRLFLVRLFSAGLAVVVTVAVIPGLGFNGWRWGEFARIALIFGLLNATVKPLLQFLVLRFIFSTYGIVVVIINTLLLLLLGAILDDTFTVYRPVSLVFGGVVVGIMGLIFETLLGATPPVLDRDYKERNGLR